MLNIKKIITSAVAASLGLALLAGCSPPGHEVYVTNEDRHYVLKMMPCEKGTLHGVTVMNANEPVRNMNQYPVFAWWASAIDDKGIRELTLFENNPKYEIYSDYHWDTIDNFELIVSFPVTPAPTILQGRLKELKPDEALTSRGIVPLESITNTTCNR